MADDKIVIDYSDWIAVRDNLTRFGPKFRSVLRVSMKEAVDEAVQEVKATLRQPPPSGGRDDVGSREAVANATKASVSFRAASFTAAIATSTAGLKNGTKDHSGFMKSYNMASFRHPIFESGRQGTTRSLTGSDGSRVRRLRTNLGETAQWVTQEGRPYFGVVISKSVKKTAVVRIRGALQAAMEVTAI